MPHRLSELVALLEAGRHADAERLVAQARSDGLQTPELLRLHGLALLGLGRAGDAIEALQAARIQTPQSIEVLCNLGSAYLADGDAHNAVGILRSAQAMAPKHPAVLNGLGNALLANGDAAAARDSYLAAARAAPNYAGAWLNLAASELRLGRHDIAEQLVRRLMANGEHPQLSRLLGDALAAQHRHAEAETAFGAAARLQPDHPGHPYQAGLMADEQGAIDRSRQWMERTLAIDPGFDCALSELVHSKRKLIDHDGLDALSSRLRKRVREGAVVAPFAFLSEPADADEQGRCARQFAADIEQEQAPLRQRLAFRHQPVDADAPVRLGLLSNGFGNHPTGLLTVALVEALAEGPLHLQLLATASDDASPISRRLRSAASEVHELAGSTAIDMARRIHASACEVLVDLRGWGGGNVAAALALRPAPVQINWLAYPGTSGAPWIDYAIADAVVLPDAIRAAHSEAIAWLPRCFQPNDSRRVVAEPPSRRDCGLPDDAVVFCCFNNSYKLNPASVARIWRVLHGVPDSVLWLLSGKDGADQRLRDLAATAGIDPQRLVFMAKLPHADYLARYRHADLFLDTLHYNAHTTASDALFAGCPVLTTAGDTFAGRVAASLNAHLGLDDMNVADDDAFVAQATALGRDADARNTLRERLLALRSTSPLFDMTAFAADFTALIDAIAQRHRRGDAPADIGPLPR